MRALIKAVRNPNTGKVFFTIDLIEGEKLLRREYCFDQTSANNMKTRMLADARSGKLHKFSGGLVYPNEISMD